MAHSVSSRSSCGCCARFLFPPPRSLRGSSLLPRGLLPSWCRSLSGRRPRSPLCESVLLDRRTLAGLTLLGCSSWPRPGLGLTFCARATLWLWFPSSPCLCSLGSLMLDKMRLAEERCQESDSLSNAELWENKTSYKFSSFCCLTMKRKGTLISRQPTFFLTRLTVLFYVLDAGP